MISGHFHRKRSDRHYKLIKVYQVDQSIFIFSSGVHLLYVQYVNTNETQAQNRHAHRKYPAKMQFLLMPNQFLYKVRSGYTSALDNRFNRDLLRADIHVK